MNTEQLAQLVQQRQSLLCVGLDTDPDRLPPHYIYDRPSDAVLAFNKSIIDNTLPFAIAYKPNFAFYEILGSAGWDVLAQTVQHINGRALTVADAKRGDIGNTAERYAYSIFEHLKFDAVTVNPYMGLDTLRPFLEYENKWVFVLALTSNPGASDFEWLKAGDKFLFEHVLEQVSRLAEASRAHIGYVVGATNVEAFQQVRAIVPNAWLLVPGVGAQGGDLQAVLNYGAVPQTGNLLINSSRSILYAASGQDFSSAAADEAQRLALQTAAVLR
jgi:orotidine-5'-phosphate decarboxylase